jgi:hypothetical protein
LPKVSAGLGLAELGRRNDPRRLPWITDTKADFDKAIAPDARAHGQRDARVDDLEMRHFDTLAAPGDFAPRRQSGRAKLNAERSTSLGGRNNDNGSLNLEHRNLLKGQTKVRPSGRIPGGLNYGCRRGADQVFMRYIFNSWLGAPCHAPFV